MARRISFMMIYPLVLTAILICSVSMIVRQMAPGAKGVCVLGSDIQIEKNAEYEWEKGKDVIMAAIVNAVKEAGVEDGMSQVEAVLRINEYICNTTTYGLSKRGRQASGALIDHQCVCSGYTLAFLYMCQYCGIDAEYIHGYTDETFHAWNGVTFEDGSYFVFDVTWNDNCGDFDRYAMLEPKQLSKTHHTDY